MASAATTACARDVALVPPGELSPPVLSHHWSGTRKLFVVGIRRRAGDGYDDAARVVHRSRCVRAIFASRSTHRVRGDGANARGHLLRAAAGRQSARAKDGP